MLHLQGSQDNSSQERRISSEEVVYSVTGLGCLFVLTYVLMNATYGIGAGGETGFAQMEWFFCLHACKS
jgi:hypothetical protein